MRISDQQAEQYRKRGHVIVPGFLAGDELAAAPTQFVRARLEQGPALRDGPAGPSEPGRAGRIESAIDVAEPREPIAVRDASRA